MKSFKLILSIILLDLLLILGHKCVDSNTLIHEFVLNEAIETCVGGSGEADYYVWMPINGAVENTYKIGYTSREMFQRYPKLRNNMHSLGGIRCHNLKLDQAERCMDLCFYSSACGITKFKHNRIRDWSFVKSAIKRVSKFYKPIDSHYRHSGDYNDLDIWDDSGRSEVFEYTGEPGILEDLSDIFNNCGLECSIAESIDLVKGNEFYPMLILADDYSIESSIDQVWIEQTSDPMTRMRQTINENPLSGHYEDRLIHFVDRRGLEGVGPSRFSNSRVVVIPISDRELRSSKRKQCYDVDDQQDDIITQSLGVKRSKTG